MTDIDIEIINQREGGSGVYGLYITTVVRDGSSGLEERYFLARNMVCKLVRPFGATRAPWNAYKVVNHGAARDMLRLNIERHEVAAGGNPDHIFMYPPILVELTRNDLSSIARGEAPYSRFEGTRAFERTNGEIG